MSIGLQAEPTLSFEPFDPSLWVILLTGDMIDPFAGIRADVAFDATSDHWKTDFEASIPTSRTPAAAIQPTRPVFVRFLNAVDDRVGVV